MNVAQSNRVMSRILAVVGCLVILMLAILLIRGCGRQDTPPDIPPTAQPTEEETGYRLLPGSESVTLRLRQVGDTEIWEGTDAAGVTLALVCAGVPFYP